MMNMGKENLESKVVRKNFQKFGTEVDFRIVVADESRVSEAEKNLVQAEKKCDELERIFSRFNRESELTRMNSRLEKHFQVSDQLLEVAGLALEYHRKTQGYFDPRVIVELEGSGYVESFEQIGNAKINDGTKRVDFKKELKADLIIKDGGLIFFERMDFNGLVKGFAVDQIATFLVDCGWRDFLVDCGGDMFFAGKDQNGNPWYVDIEGVPYEKLMVALASKGIATSGIGKRKWEIEGKRFHHLVNPKNPKEYDFNLKSVTVIADSVCEADVWAKTGFLMGSVVAKEFLQEKNIACAMLDYRGGIWISNEFKKYLYKKDE